MNKQELAELLEAIDQAPSPLFAVPLAEYEIAVQHPNRVHSQVACRMTFLPLKGNRTYLYKTVRNHPAGSLPQHRNAIADALKRRMFRAADEAGWTSVGYDVTVGHLWLSAQPLAVTPEFLLRNVKIQIPHKFNFTEARHLKNAVIANYTLPMTGESFSVLLSSPGCSILALLKEEREELLTWMMTTGHTVHPAVKEWMRRRVNKIDEVLQRGEGDGKN